MKEQKSRTINCESTEDLDKKIIEFRNGQVRIVDIYRTTFRAGVKLMHSATITYEDNKLLMEG